MRKIVISLILTIISIALLYAVAGISFGPGEITFSNLEIGQSYDFSKLSSQQFEVVNKSSGKIDVEIVKYSGGRNYKGAESLPDLKWIKVFPEKLKGLEPGKKYKVSLKITVPNKKKYLGKKYYFYLQARVSSKSFMSIGASSRVFIKIKDRRTGSNPPKGYKLAKFKVEPLEIHINDLKLGQEYICKDLMINNLSDRDLKFKIILMDSKRAKRELFSGYNDFPGIDTSGAKQDFYEVPAKKKAKVKISFFLENKKEYRNKKYQLFINVRTYKESVVQEFYVPIFIEKVSRFRGAKGSRE